MICNLRFTFCLFTLMLSVSLLYAQHPAKETAQSILQVADSFYYQSNWNAAKEKYTVYLSDSSGNAMAWNRLGFSNYNLGAYDESIKNYERSLASKPSPQVKFIAESRMAKVFAKKNNAAESVNWLNKAIGDGYANLNELDSSADFANIRNLQAFKDARQRVFISAYPCTIDTNARKFDFWIGEWDAYQTGTNNLAGHSIIQSISGGCAILENWTSHANAYSGKSINYYDTTTKMWEQDWVGSGGDVQRFVNGKYTDQKMMFTFTTTQNGQKAIGNFIFYNLGPDKVRQYQEISVDNGKTFQVSYDFTYIRKK